MILEILRKFFQPIMPLFRLSLPKIASEPSVYQQVSDILYLERRVKNLHDELWETTRLLNEKSRSLKWEKQWVYIPAGTIHELGEDALDRLRAYQQALESDLEDGAPESEARFLNGEDQKYGV